MDVVSTYGVSFSLVGTQIIIIIIIIIIIMIIIDTTGTHFLASTNTHSPQRTFIQERN
jgi:uncharacterized integral membrane protein